MARRKERLPDDTVRLCPEELPDGFIEWARYNFMREEHVLLYKKGNRRGVCYCCGRQVTAYNGQKFIQHTRNYCPSCGEEVLCVLSGSNSFLAEYVCNAAALQKGTDGETVFARLFHIRRDPDAEYERPRQWIQEIARYAIRGELAARWVKEVKDSWYGYVTERYPGTDWRRMESPAKIYDGPYKFYPELSPLEGSRLQYGAAERYLANAPNPNIISYLVNLARYPVMEYLVKRGYYRIVDERCNGMSKENRNAILWSRKKLKDCFRIPLRLLEAKPAAGWTLYGLTKLNRLWEHCKAGELTEEEALMLFDRALDYDSISAGARHARPAKILAYYDRQSATDRNVRLTDYRDYICECEALSLDLTDKQVLFPADLMAAHARTTAQVEFKANAEKNEKLAARAAELGKYGYRNCGYFIRPAHSMEELIIEGKVLHHCVASYAERMAKGHTAIFFIRRADAPDTPFYTLEYKDKRVIQCRTKENVSYERDPEVKAFVEEWLEAIAKIDKKKKRKAA